MIASNGNSGADGFDDNNVIRLIDGSVGNFDFNTIVDNNINSDSGQVVNNGSSIIRLRSSIVHENIDVPVYTASTALANIFNCLIVHEDVSLGGEDGIEVADPGFVDRAGGDYHLDPAISPAVDFCDDIPVSLVGSRDIDNDERGFDWPNIVDNLGPYDLGFDEATDLIFAHGFEEAK